MICLGLLVLASSAWATPAHGGGVENVGKMLFGLVIILIAAKLGGHVLVRAGQPAVLGELVFGIIIGNLSIFNVHCCSFIRNDLGVRVLSEVGVILLLFQVGLESDIAKMAKVGASSLLVATLGVIAPFLLGWGVATWLLPDESIYVHLFIGATLCATSVGITARVMLDLGWVRTPEARIILGAAVIDDVQGLIILSVVSGLVSAAACGTAMSSASILAIIAKSTAFLVGAVFLGRWVAPRLFSFASRLKAADLLLTTALGICFAFAGIASAVGLAPIVGAFAAGLILEEVHWRGFRERGEHSVEELVKPLVAFLAPIFFVVMGAGVSLKSLGRVDSLALAAVLVAAAILGKQACSLGVLQKGLDRVSVGVGMIPRGEVGLIFAAIGSQLKIYGHPVVNAKVYSAIVMVVIVTTLITPPALKWSIGRHVRAKHSHGVADSDSGNQ
jgi:Kef-type K+ transport system membrane component KefB